MSRIRLIAVDLDGTLLDSTRRVSNGAADAVTTALERGVLICLASGRAPSTILPFADQLGIRGPIVSCNGALLLGPDRELVGADYLGSSGARLVLDYAAQTGVHTNLYSGSDVYFSHDEHWASVYRSRTGVAEKGVLDYRAMSEIPATKILFIDSGDAIERHRQAILEILGSGNAEIVLSETEYIEFLPVGVNKGTGLAKLASALSLHQGQVAAIGDYLNDLEMVQWAGFSGAVANAAPEVREHADLVVASNDEGGVAEFILASLELGPRL